MSEMSMGGVDAAAPMAAQLTAAMTKQELDVMKQQGQAAVELIEAVPEAKPQGSLGNNLDVKA
ncbi:MAG: hypothetical protein HQL47_08705 [Gammaproteobacteria bacterium]|nr:hypothetical protein [Gammaproteobacteria bacterium]